MHEFAFPPADANAAGLGASLFRSRESARMRRECAMIQVEMLKRATFQDRLFSLSLSFPPPPPPVRRLPPLLPARLLFPVSFAAKTNATYLSTSTAGLPSSSTSFSSPLLDVPPSSRCVYPPAGSEDPVRRGSASARVSRFFFPPFRCS